MIIERNLFLKEWIYCFERQKNTHVHTQIMRTAKNILRKNKEKNNSYLPS